jgi:hypothetical protein
MFGSPPVSLLCGYFEIAVNLEDGPPGWKGVLGASISILCSNGALEPQGQSCSEFAAKQQRVKLFTTFKMIGRLGMENRR